eukprot:COSAG04_NODE_1499_length_6523_cov_2.604141_4_plen_380_part_00
MVAGGSSSASGRPSQTELILTLVNAVDAADMALLPGIFRVLEMDFAVSPKQLGSMVLVQNVLKSAATIFWGFVADRLSRKQLLARACLVWGALTLAIAICTSFTTLAALRVLSVAVLAVMMPLSQGMLSDMIAPARRGSAFGRLGFWSNLGAMAGGALSTALSSVIILGAFRGWRLSFGVVGGCSLLLVPVISARVVEPPRPGRPGSTEAVGLGAGQSLGVVATLRVIFSKPTFALLVLQGLFGEMPWVAFGTFSTLFLQYAGLSDSEVAFLFVLRSVGGAAGTLFGGWFGDYMHARYPDHGRVFVAQMTVFLGIPAMVTVLHAIPQDASSFWLYAVALFAFGFVAVWTPPATNRPILCEICVPELRASILGTWVGKPP